ncbi:MAG: 2-oxoacid:acceptor oxidoreductase family protein, partial [Candidatus Aminicenantes bacterium]|nr:2-oxoacid:acceptor oxidoreductase family protein [Candidatus Aminicenantes bacterium]
RADGILIYDTDLVRLKPARDEIRYFGVPSTRFAEEMGNRIFANLVMLGFFTAITKVVTPEAMKKALPGLVPKRFLELNIRAFEKGYDYGIELLTKEMEGSPSKIKPKEKLSSPKPKKSPSRKARS